MLGMKMIMENGPGLGMSQGLSPKVAWSHRSHLFSHRRSQGEMLVFLLGRKAEVSG
jgi:hypothetical protein